MRRTTIENRWSTPGRRYAGGWRQNPWINAMCNALHARSETECSSATGPDDRLQRAAVKTWENEGGRLGTDPDRKLSY